MGLFALVKIAVNFGVGESGTLSLRMILLSKFRSILALLQSVLYCITMMKFALVYSY